MAVLESWLVNLTGGYYLWVLEVFLIVVCSFVFGHLVNRLINMLERHAAKSKTVWDDAIIEAFRRPAIWAIWIIGINLAASVASKAAGSEIHDLINLVNRASIIFLSALFLINLFTYGLPETHVLKVHLIESVPYFRYLLMGMGLL